MESFCFPAVPCPTRKPVLEPSVPDASLLMNAPSSNTYQAWRNNLNTVDQSKKVTTSILKKQVRFDGPDIPFFQQVETEHNNDRFHGTIPNDTLKTSTTQCNTPPLNKVLKNKPFQEIYMANIPNRHLDLSLIDLTKPSSNPNFKNITHTNAEINKAHVENLVQTCTPPQKPPTTYKEFLEMQKNLKESEKRNEKYEANDCITDIFNYTSPKIELRKRPNKIGKLVGDICETSRNERCIISDNHCAKPNMNRKLPNPTFNKPHTCNITEEENIGYDNSEIPVNQQQLPTTTTAYNYNSFDFRQDLQRYRSHTHQLSEKYDSSVQTSIIDLPKKEEEKKHIISTEVAKNTEEPTVKDLLKIIQQQNEQLLVLQKQVASLLDFKDAQKSIEYNHRRIAEENKFIQPIKDQREYLNSAGSTPRKGPLPKFSIDLMTSFEVSFRPQQNMYQRKPRDFITQEPKIKEIIENDMNAVHTKDPPKGITDPSLYLQEPITVPESCPSPEPSIRIDMKDYESSEDDEDTASDIGATFYKNMMDQVNKIIQNAQKQTTYDGKISKNDDLKDRTLSKVRDATIKQLKKIGMNFSPIEEVSDANCSNMSQDETSEQINLAVKQLLMKYLPDDQLSKFTGENNGGMDKKRSTDKIVLNSRGPQFSFATVQFMKKYDLIANDGKETPKKLNTQEQAKPTRIYRAVSQNNPKILDISTLKQQPKLL